MSETEAGMSELTGAEREALADALRQCRVEDDAPIRLVREGDIFHVVHMLKEPITRITAARAEGEVREAERTAEHWEGLWQVAIERAEAAERKVKAADILRKRWARDARDGDARGSSYALTYREAANELRAALRDESTP